MKFYVYVLFLFNRKQLYVGFSSELPRRVEGHQGNKVKSTKSLGEEPKLIFYEVYWSKEDAQRRERYLKTTQGKRALKLMLKETLKEIS